MIPDKIRTNNMIRKVVNPKPWYDRGMWVNLAAGIPPED
jgi:hypothetical protein